MIHSESRKTEIAAILAPLLLPELRELVTQATALIAEREKSEKVALAEEIKTLAIARGVAVADLLPLLGSAPGRSDGEPAEKASKARGTVPPKYRDPSEPSNTWTGRGRKPKWVLEREAEGKTLESMLIGM